MVQYAKNTGFQHGTAASPGILIANLGTPEAPTSGAVRKYLAQFLSDPRLIELPRWQWLPILHGVILRIRPARSAHAYQKVWTDEGSPLLLHSQSLAAKIDSQLKKLGHGTARVELGMTYGQPSIAGALDRLFSQPLSQLIVLPLYPQYSATTTASVMDQLGTYLSRARDIPDLSFISSYHDDSTYIKALADSVTEFWRSRGRRKKLLFSFHGIPRRYLDSGDPYHCQCHKTARLVASQLGLDESDWHLSFQSRVGREEWLRPYTDELLAEWGKAGQGDIDVICPGFAVDCLETLEEIAMQNRDDYKSAGGGELSYIPCLNDSEAQVYALSSLINERIQTKNQDKQSLEASRKRALALGANQ